MLLFLSHHRRAHHRRHKAADIAPQSPPTSYTLIDLSMQIQRRLHITKTLSSSASSASSSSSPLQPQPPHDFQSSSPKPPDTDPASIQALWDEVACFTNRCYPPDALDINIMTSSSSLPYVPSKDYDPQGFSSTAFPKLLEQHQIIIRKDSVDVRASLWAYFRDAAKGAPAEELSELESCRAWGGNDTDTTAKTEEWAAQFKALLLDLDVAQLDCRQFVTDRILRVCNLPGVRLNNNPKMFDVGTEPYQLPPKSISTTIGAGKSAVHSTTNPHNSTSSLAQSISPSSAGQSGTASEGAAQPMGIDPPPVRELDLPGDNLDCAYWLEASNFQQPTGCIARFTFVSNGTSRKLSPYLSIAFENSACPTLPEKRLSVKHKMAVYGPTALYNRCLLHINAPKIGGKTSSSGIKLVDRSACDVHFGLAVMKDEATLYVFQREKSPSGRPEQDRANGAWHGCSMSKLGVWLLTAPDDLADLLRHLRIVADWARRVYVPMLQGDLTQWSDSLGRHWAKNGWLALS